MDVTQTNFKEAVIERSWELPVVVDFWAEWCGPCRQLGPILERAVAARAGKIELVKVDVDGNPLLARDHRIQGIPAVKAFRDGVLAGEFTGAQPQAAVERFLDSLLPSEADLLVDRGDEESLRQAHELEPTRADAALALAEILRRRGDLDQASAILKRVPGSFAGEGLQSRIELERGSAQAAIGAGAPDLREAFAAIDARDYQRALALLIDAMTSADGARENLRRVVVGILDQLGVEDPVARTARRRLASVLY